MRNRILIAFYMSLYSLIVLFPACMADNVLGFEDTIEKALKIGGGKVNIDLSWRFAYADDSSLKRQGYGDPFRICLGYLTPEFHGLSAFAEYEGVQTVFAGKYNSVVNQNNTNRATITDPERHEVNRLWLQYTGIPGTNLKIGRQRIKLDNERFIGNVGWRQLEQTFDAVRLTNKSLVDTELNAGYIWKQRDVFSNNINMDTFFVNASYNGFEYGKITGYAYLQDYDAAGDSLAFKRSNHTYGISFQGAAPINKSINLIYKAEFARQWDFQDNPENYATNYWNGEIGFDISGVTIKGGIEQLSANNDIGFQTPLATLHAYNGWADQFLATPPDGLQDIYVSVSTKIYGIKLLGVYHNFSDEDGDVEYGDEFNALAVKKFGKHYSILLKYAHYEADTFKTDTDKFWLQSVMSF